MPDSAKPVVAIVDPISTGASLAKFLADLGYPLVRVFSDTLPDEAGGARGKTKLAQAAARLSRGLSQRQIVPWAGPSSGRFGRAGLPHRPCSRHQVKALVAEGLEVDWQVTLPSYHPIKGRLAGDVT